MTSEELRKLAAEPYGNTEVADFLNNAADEIDRLKEYLRQLATVAAIHYGGGGFDPEHMRAIANACLAALRDQSIDDGEFKWAEYAKPYHVLEIEAERDALELRVAELEAFLKCSGPAEGSARAHGATP